MAAIQTATDVLRLAAAMSDGDASLAAACKFGKFRRRERAMLLGWVERAENRTEEVSVLIFFSSRVISEIALLMFSSTSLRLPPFSRLTTSAVETMLKFGENVTARFATSNRDGCKQPDPQAPSE